MTSCCLNRQAPVLIVCKDLGTAHMYKPISHVHCVLALHY
jgi:hypothetical protein